MPTLPGGPLTFLFTDIAGSARLWQDHPDSMPAALARHDVLLREAIEGNNGFVIKTIGDAFMAGFPTARDGVNAAIAAQRSLCSEVWATETPVRVRMGLHTGEATARDNDYYGHEVNRAARIQSVAHPEQIVLSQATRSLADSSLPDGVTLLDLGSHQLKDLRESENLWQLCHPDLPSLFPPLNSLTHWPNNLPRQISSFTGRESQIKEVKSLLSHGSCLTLVGSGGCGKTRLALQVAADVLPDYPHGVWLVELAALTEPSLVPQAVAAALGLREEPGKTLTQTLSEYAHSRVLLLLLDNCEHLLDACAQLTAALLRACPQIKVLTTSRETLNIAGEKTYRVPSLSLPDPKQTQTPESLHQYEACRLFIERASAVKPGFAVTSQSALTLASLCHHLDGIPLALELAAARIRSLSIEDIHSRLDHRFHLLTGGNRAALPRQQTLRAALDWSYDLLTESERGLLQRLSVFSGGWSLAAAEAVCANVGAEDAASETAPRSALPGLEEWEVLDMLSSLVDKSLVLAEERDGTVRYRLLETVRRYGTEKLAESAETTTRRRQHRNWYLALAEEASPQLGGAEQAHWLNALEAEHDNLRQALGFCLEEPGEVKAGLRLAAAMQRFWGTRGYLVEGRERLAVLLVHPEAQEPTRTRADMLRGAGSLAWQQGDYAAARSLYEQSLALSRTLENQQGIAASLNNLGLLAHDYGDYVQARVLHEESLALHRTLEDRRGIVASLNNLGIVAWSQGDFSVAQALHRESLAIRRAMADKQGIAMSLSNLANIAKDQGDYGQARSLHEESLTLHREVGDRRGIAHSLNNLATVAIALGDHVQAKSLQEESLAIRRELGDRHGIAMSLDNLANVASAQGDYVQSRSLQEESLAIRKELGDRKGIATSLNNLGLTASHQADYGYARSLFAEGLTIMWELGNKLGIVGGLEGCASLAFAEGDPASATRLWGSAERLREEMGSPLPPAEREKHDCTVAAARQAFGEEAFAAAWSAGREMSLEYAVESLLDHNCPSNSS